MNFCDVLSAGLSSSTLRSHGLHTLGELSDISNILHQFLHVWMTWHAYQKASLGRVLATPSRPAGKIKPWAVSLESQLTVERSSRVGTTTGTRTRHKANATGESVSAGQSPHPKVLPRSQAQFLRAS